MAIPPNAVTVLGQMALPRQQHRFQVTPIVGLIPPDVQFHANEGEVADVFEMPLREALTLSRYYPLDIHRAGHTHRIYLSWYHSQFIWG